MRRGRPPPGPGRAEQPRGCSRLRAGRDPRTFPTGGRLVFGMAGDNPPESRGGWSWGRIRGHRQITDSRRGQGHRPAGLPAGAGLRSARPPSSCTGPSPSPEPCLPPPRAAGPGAGVGSWLFPTNENPPPQQSKCFSEKNHIRYLGIKSPPLSNAQGHALVGRMRGVVLSPVSSYRYCVLSMPQPLKRACICLKFIQGFLSGRISVFQS